MQLIKLPLISLFVLERKVKMFTETIHSDETIWPTNRVDFLVSTKGIQSVTEIQTVSNFKQSLLNLYSGSKWLVCESIHLSCIAVALYLLYALLHHKIIQNQRHKYLGHKRKGGALLENLCIVGILLALCRFINNQVLLFHGWSSSSLCSLLLNISIAMYFISIQPVYLFLWVRQRIFYSSPSLRHLFSKHVQVLSWATLVSFIMTSIVSMVFFVIDAKNSATGRVCQLSDKLLETNLSEQEILDEARHQGVKVNTVTGLVASVIQVCFLALFLYPIMDSKLQEMRIEHMRSGRRALISLIRRSFLLAGCCIVGDVAIVFIIKTIHLEVPDAIFAPLATYDANLILNFLCIIMTFRRWKTILFPWYYTRCGTNTAFLHSRKAPTFNKQSSYKAHNALKYDPFSSIISRKNIKRWRQKRLKVRDVSWTLSPVWDDFRFPENLRRQRIKTRPSPKEEVKCKDNSDDEFFPRSETFVYVSCVRTVEP